MFDHKDSRMNDNSYISSFNEKVISLLKTSPFKLALTLTGLGTVVLASVANYIHYRILGFGLSELNTSYFNFLVSSLDYLLVVFVFFNVFYFLGRYEASKYEKKQGIIHRFKGGISKRWFEINNKKSFVRELRNKIAIAKDEYSKVCSEYNDSANKILPYYNYFKSRVHSIKNKIKDFKSVYAEEGGEENEEAYKKNKDLELEVEALNKKIESIASLLDEDYVERGYKDIFLNYSESDFTCFIGELKESNRRKKSQGDFIDKLKSERDVISKEITNLRNVIKEDIKIIREEEKNKKDIDTRISSYFGYEKKSNSGEVIYSRSADFKKIFTPITSALIFFLLATTAFATIFKSVPANMSDYCSFDSFFKKILLPICVDVEWESGQGVLFLNKVYEVGYTPDSLLLKFASSKSDGNNFSKSIVIPKKSIIAKRYSFNSLPESPPGKPKPEKAIKFINNGIVTGSFESTSLTRGIDSGKFFPPPAQFSCFENGDWIAYIKHLEGSSEVFPQCGGSSNEEKCKEITEHNKNEIVSLSNKMSSGNKLVSMSFASSSGSSSGNMDITQKRAHAVFDAIKSEAPPEILSKIILGIENFIGRGEDSSLMTQAIKTHAESRPDDEKITVNQPFSLVSVCKGEKQLPDKASIQ